VIDAGSIEYAHARLWARNGERPDESSWRSLEVVRDFAAFVDMARRLPAFRNWVARIAPDAGIHEIESAMRESWRALVDDVAGWMPHDWQPSVRWCAVLIDVPVVQYLARGGAMLAWIERDSRYRELAGENAATLGPAFHASPLTPLSIGFGRPDNLMDLWREEWRRRLPHDCSVDDTRLVAVSRVLSEHLKRARASTISDGTSLRRELQANLLALFRKALTDPASAFIFLALCALDLERLRGELLRRAAFPRLPLAA
jgi:hypothetical protein